MASQGMQQVQRMGLHQVLAPQLQQSLHLLQVPVLELRSLVAQELQTNPTLEEVADQSQEEEAEKPAEDVDSATAKTEKTSDEEDSSAEDAEFKEEFDQLAKLDEEWREYFGQSGGGFSYDSEDEERRQFFLDSQVRQESLQEHLINQLRTAEASEQDRKLGELIIGSIDDRGYLTSSLEDLSASTGVSAEDLGKALHLIQEFHPVGVAARDLRECLLIQLDRLGKSEEIESVVVANHLEDLGKKRFPEISRTLGITVEQVQQIANFISTLDPKPGSRFSAEPDNYVQPDVLVQKVDGEWVIILNDEQIPHLRISNTYKELMAQSSNKDDVKNYIRDKIRSGKFLIKSIHQRQQTIRNVAKVIVDRQMEFLEKGVAHLKPLTMGQVADVVGVHETTVSRAIANKYMQTPQGVFEMKYFFTPGFQTASGQSISNTSVKDAIKEVFEKEDQTKPLSDQEIVAILGAKGITIARRTVAKYRNEMNILPSNLRRKF
jgi:RNA polymerase sigma-54 factor